ncbi:hypothetical protein [Vreelandella alkaliphila]|uniref:hypothetical protein n=1 Tax=Vreelandella alkaliphila TaxID=272774 RepID=UPI003FD701F8
MEDICNLNAKQIQYLCAALLKFKDFSNFDKIINFGLKKFPYHVGLLNLQYIFFERSGDYISAKAIAHSVIENTSTNNTLLKWNKRLADLEFKLEVKIFERKSSFTVVAYSQDLVVKYNNSNKSNVIVVSFWGDKEELPKTTDGFRSLLSRPGYAEKFIIESGYDLLTVNKRVYNFYQDISRQDLHDMIEPICKNYKNVFMYGGSGGGYAALYYSVGLDYVIPIAFSPRIRIDPSTGLNTKNDVNYPSFSHVPLSDLIAKNKAYIFYDPFHEADNSFINCRVLPSFKKANLFKLPFSGHGAFMLSELGVIKELFYKMVKNECLEMSFVDSKKSKIYHYHLIKYLFKIGKFKSALDITFRSLIVLHGEKTRFDKVDIYNLAMKSLIKNNMRLCAEKLHEEFKKENWFSQPKNKYSNFPKKK